MPAVSASSTGLVTPIGHQPAVVEAREENPDLVLLDLKVSDIQVPKVGDVKTDDRRNVPKYIVGPDGEEVVWVSRVLSLLRHEGLAAATCKTYARSFYRAAVVIWALGLDPQHLTAIQWAVVRGWLAACMRRTTAVPGDMARPLSASTAAGTESAMLTIYKKALRLGLVDVNPVAELRGDDTFLIGTTYYDTGFSHKNKPSGGGKTFTVPAKQIKVVDDATEHLLRNARRSRDRALWTLCLDTGPRISEALSLTPSTFYRDENRASVVAKGKDGATRDIPVSDASIEAIDEYLADLRRHGWQPAPHDQIFRSVKAPYEPLAYGGAWAALRRATGNPDVHPHALRHTAATNMLDLVDGSEGMRLIVVQIMLGHTNVATTRKYLHVETKAAIGQVITALNTPRQRSQSGLDEFYNTDHMNMLESIWKEAL